MPSRVVVDDDEQIIADLLREERRLRGRLATTRVQGGKDAFTVAATPATDYPLTCIPVVGTCEVSLNGDVLEEDADYTVDYDVSSATAGVLSVSASLSSGDVLTARYLQTDWLVARSLPPEVDGVFDNFNRPDSATDPNPRSDGGLWTVPVATVAGISSNRFYIVSGAASPSDAVTADVGSKSQDVTFTSIRPTTSGAAAVLIAYGFDPVTSQIGGYSLLFDSGTFFQVQAAGSGGGSPVNVTGYSSWTGGSTTLRCTFNAVTREMKLYQNGSGTPFWTNTFASGYQYATEVGFWLLNSNEYIDDFSAVPL